MFDRILIANRGEIACRVIATARRMGIHSVAVYSAADATARHVRLADSAQPIGPAPARDSYLRIDAILDAARKSGAQAIHPGYGFLSENPDFADACAAAGIVFIGPPASAMRAMGSKAAAKTLMQAAGVALVPGYHGADQSPDLLASEAARIGYPVLLKASAGGGGKGMRVVTQPADLADAVARAQSEARASFGDDHLLIEKYLTQPRHIEVQVFADSHGRIVSLFERDCSIQRRHQKVVEEAPALGIGAAARARLGDAAIAAARAVGYVGAGTVEFIHEADEFFFMEMNTRLQVEHPVTEFVTGLDLVEWQFRVAAGEALPQPPEAPHGHAIEVRICAEDPAQDFRPATGPIAFLRQPAPGPHVRVDTGVEQGDRITPFYDSMIAKLIVWDTDRPAALRRLRQALAEYQLVGPHTNLDLLRGIATDAEFAAGAVDTGFIGRHPALLATPVPDAASWAAACLALARLRPAQPAADPWSPWGATDGWALNAPATFRLDLQHGDTRAVIEARHADGDAWRLDLPTGPVTARLTPAADGTDVLLLDGARQPLRVLVDADTVTVLRDGIAHAFHRIDPLAPPAPRHPGEVKLTAPTPARIVAVLVRAGDAVTRGQKLLVLEAMKVETTFTAPRDGTIEAVHVQPDQQVAEAAPLVTFTAPDPPA